MAKKKNTGLGLLLLAGIGLGGYAYSRKEPAHTPGPEPAPKPPRWVPGPGNEGRIYGDPGTLDPPGDWYGGNRIAVDPQCEWIIEGDGFLPVGDAMVFPTAGASSLASAIAVPTGTAWAYVRHLVDAGWTPSNIASSLLVEAANGTAKAGVGLSGPADGQGCINATSRGVAAWLADTSERVSAWIAARPTRQPGPGPLPPPPMPPLGGGLR